MTVMNNRESRRVDYTNSLVGVPANARNAFVCFSILEAFPRSIPAAEQLMIRYGMGRATAYRYRAALMAVRGQS